MKAEELINNNVLQNIEVVGNQKVVFNEIALTAVSMARKEVGDKAVEAFADVFKEILGNCYQSDIDRFKAKLKE